MSGHDIMVLGASAGGVEALIKIVSSLPANLPAAVFVVLHMPAETPSRLPAILGRAGILPVLQPTNKTAIRHGCIYVAAPDHHLIIENGFVGAVRGPKENRSRPAVDPLFRSAAYVYGPRVVGVVVSGALDDGTAGLMAIKQRGGIAVVQNPEEALYSGMPRSAVEHVAVDYILPLEEIGPLLKHLAHQQVADEVEYPVSEEMDKEVRIASMDTAELQSDNQPGTPSAFSCPECGGVLWELQDGELLRFRCRVGHAFSSETVLAEQNEALEQALWVALKTIQESATLARRLATQARQRGHSWLVTRFEERAQQADERGRVIQQVLQNGDSFNPKATYDELPDLVDDKQAG